MMSASSDYLSANKHFWLTCRAQTANSKTWETLYFQSNENCIENPNKEGAD